MRKRETYWLIGTIILVLILNLAIFGIDGFKSESFTKINIHDAYFVIAKFHLILLFAVFIFFVIYLIRTIRWDFKNLTANVILIIVIILLSIIINGINSIVDSFIQQTSGWTIYPPTSVGEIERKVGNKGHYLNIFSNTIFIIQIALLILLAYCGFKTGRNYNRN